MAESAGRKIVDIGCGSQPWYVLCDSMDSVVGSELSTPLMRELTTLAPEDTYVCIDRSGENIAKAAGRTEELRQRSSTLRGRIEFLTCDATRLPFADGTLDYAIISNVLSAPRWREGGEYCEELCVEEKNKAVLLNEALRVLSPRGSLVVAIYFTPAWAKRAMKHLRNLCDRGLLKLAIQYGVYAHWSEDWHLYEAKFQKPEGFGGVTTFVPWTSNQREYMRKWADRLLFSLI